MYILKKQAHIAVRVFIPDDLTKQWKSTTDPLLHESTAWARKISASALLVEREYIKYIDLYFNSEL